MRVWVIAAAAAALAAPAALPAQKGKPQARPEAFEALVRCRALADDSARLKCFDEASATLERAAENRDLVVVDRKQIREAKRGLFGLDLPDFNPFGGGGGDDGVEEIKSIESAVRSATRDQNGRWILTLEDGSIWAQTDSNPFAVEPKRGHKVKVVKAAMGSYMMRVNGQPGVRAKRRI